jgi:HEAT repeat protein
LSQRQIAIRALLDGKIVGENWKQATVVPALMASLDDPDFQTRWNVCLALGNFGTRAKIAIPSLQAALNDKNSSVRGMAAIALVQIESDDIVTLDSMMPILIENLNGSAGRGVNFRFPTAETLASWGDKAKAAVPALLNAVKNTSGYEQQEILNDLKKIDPEAAANAVQK